MKLITNPKKKIVELNWARLEYSLIVYFRPTFLLISDPRINDDVQIIISSIKFNYLPIQGRVAEVFKLINEKCPEILENRLLLVQAYNSQEIEDVLVEIFS